jgi:hypothetical protein
MNGPGINPIIVLTHFRHSFALPCLKKRTLNCLLTPISPTNIAEQPRFVSIANAALEGHARVRVTDYEETTPDTSLSLIPVDLITRNAKTGSHRPKIGCCTAAAT